MSRLGIADKGFRGTQWEGKEGSALYLAAVQVHTRLAAVPGTPRICGKTTVGSRLQVRKDYYWWW